MAMQPRSRRLIWIATALLVPLAILIAFGPWDAVSDEQFEARGVRVVALAAGALAVLLYLVPLLNKWARSGRPESQPERRGFAASPVVVLLFGGIAVLALLVIAQIALFRFHLNERWVVAPAIAGQQVCLVIMAVLIQVPRGGAGRGASRVVSLVISAVLAVFLSAATPTILRGLAENMLSATPDPRTLLYAIPAVAAAIVGVLRELTRRRTS